MKKEECNAKHALRLLEILQVNNILSQGNLQAFNW